MRKFAIIFALTALAGLSACSSTVRSYTQTLKLAFAPGEGAVLTREDLASRDHDALYAKIGNLPRAVLGLAYIEHGQRKWISADNALLVLDSGRLVKTTGFKNDLLFQSDTAQDPLKNDIAKIKVGQTWKSLTDWSGDYETGYLTQYEVVKTEVAQVEIMGHIFQTKLVTEQVLFANGRRATNLFWFDLNSGYLLRSLQTIAPFWPEVELVHISTAGRLMGIRNKGNKK